MNSISIVICSYNGSNRIATTLQHIALQRISTTVSLEVILIDNNSSDDLQSIAKAVWKQLGDPYRLTIYFEERRGLIYAKQKGIETAGHDCIIFCDDDNWLTKDYCQLAIDFLRNNPAFGIVGGRAIAVANEPLPDWFFVHQMAYACGAPCDDSRDITGMKMTWGAGMVINRSLALKIFDRNHPFLLTGRQGASLSSGEDDEICLRAWLMGQRSYYYSELVLMHYMETHRLTEDYLSKLNEGFVGQGIVTGSYMRLYNLIDGVYNKGWRIVKQLFVYFKSTIIRDEDASRLAADMLFYLTRSDIWKNDINGRIWLFFLDSRAAIHL